MPMFNLIEYSQNYSQRPGRLSQYYRDGPNDNNGNIITNSESFKYKTKITGKTPADAHTKDA